MQQKIPKKSKVSKFFISILALLFVAAIVYALQNFYQILDTPWEQFKNYLSAANGVFYKQMMWGVSAGTFLFITILIIFPILMRNINTGSYFRNLFQGIISSFIFFISQAIYDFFARINKFYLLVSIAGVALITLVLIRIVAGMYRKKEDQVEFRTAYVASITAGLIFGVMLQLFNMGFDYIKEYLVFFNLNR